MTGTHESSELASVRRVSYIGGGVVVMLIAGLVAWAALTPIEGAVTADGVVTVKGDVKSIAQPFASTVSSIRVHNGSDVKAGDILFELDANSLDQQLASAKQQQVRIEVKAERLQQESINAPSFQAPTTLAPDADPGVVAAAVADETRLMQADQADRDTSLSSARAQLSQAQAQYKAAQAALAGDQSQAAQLSQQLAATESLSETVSGDAQISSLKTQIATAGTQVAAAQSQVGQMSVSLAQAQGQVASVTQQYESRALTELDQAKNDDSTATQRVESLQGQLDATTVRAPVSGVVSGSIVSTTGSAVPAGTVLMQIVPRDVPFVIVARVPVSQVSHVGQGAQVHVSLPTLDRVTTPQLEGKVVNVAANSSLAPGQKAAAYDVSIAIPDQQLKLLPKSESLIQGMSAQVFIAHGDGTVLSYLVEPLVERMQYAFRS